MNQQKKLLIITDWFAPGYKAGGPIQSCVNICTALNSSYDIYVLTTDTDHGDTDPYPGIEAGRWLKDPVKNISILYLEKKKLHAKEIARQVSLVNADIVYLNHLFSPYFVVYPLWLAFKGFIKSKVVVCPRGALYDSALSLKAYKKKPLLLLYKWLGIHKKITFHATNKREYDAIEKKFPGSAIIIADNLPNTKQDPFVPITKEAGKLDCIFIARIVPIKNLLFLLNALQNCTSQVRLTVVGPVENENYWEECKRVINVLPGNIRVHYIGPRQNSELSALIQKHHLFILPTTGENFGHSIFESLLSGRPVLISDQTPWLQLQKEKAGWDIPVKEPAAFTGMIDHIAAFSQDEYNEYAKGAWQYAQSYIANKISKNQYYQLFA